MDRPASPSESQFLLMDYAGNVNFVLSAELREAVSGAALRAALDELQEGCAALRTRVHLLKGFQFRGDSAPLIPLRISEADWVKEIEAELHTTFDIGTGPLARCVLVRGADRTSVLLTLHHGVLDGLSGVELLQRLISSLDSSTPRATRPPAAPGIAMEARLPRWAVGWRAAPRLLRAVLILLAQWLRKGVPLRMRMDVRAPVAHRRRHVRPMSLGASVTHRLVERARLERTTVHGAVCAATLIAVAEDINAEQSLPLCCLSMVSLRHRLKPLLERETGLFISVAPTSHRVRANRDGFWDLAREVRDQLSASMARGDPLVGLSLTRLLVPSLLKLVSPPQGDRIEERLSAGPGTFVVTNLGVVELAPSDTVGAVHFAASPFGGVSFCNSVLTQGGVLRCSFVYTSPLIEHARAERLAKRTMAKLEEAAAAHSPLLAESDSSSRVLNG